MSLKAYIATCVRESKWLGKPTFNWLTQDYNKKSTVYSHVKRLENFLEWLQKTDVQLVEEYNNAENKDEWSRDTGKLIVEYYNHLVNKGYAKNTARANLSGIRAFCRSQCTSLKVRRRAIPKAQRAKGEHVFTREELTKMFFVADIRDKAVLSTAVCLGYGATDFLNLKRDFIQRVIDNATEENITFPSFHLPREKTDVSAYSHLTPEAIKSLSAFLKTSNPNATYLFHNHTVTNAITSQALNDIIKKLVEKAGIKTTGKVKFHLLRKFLMSSCVEANFNAFETKLKLGKDIGVSDSTYLVTLEKSVDEKTEALYKRIRLTSYVNNNSKIEQLEAEVKQLKNLQPLVDVLVKLIQNEITKKQAKTELKKIKEYYAEEHATPEEEEEYHKRADELDKERNNQ